MEHTYISFHYSYQTPTSSKQSLISSIQLKLTTLSHVMFTLYRESPTNDTDTFDDCDLRLFLTTVPGRYKVTSDPERWPATSQDLEDTRKRPRISSQSSEGKMGNCGCCSVLWRFVSDSQFSFSHTHTYTLWPVNFFLGPCTPVHDPFHSLWHEMALCQ